MKTYADETIELAITRADELHTQFVAEVKRLLKSGAEGMERLHETVEALKRAGLPVVGFWECPDVFSPELMGKIVIGREWVDDGGGERRPVITAERYCDDAS